MSNSELQVKFILDSTSFPELIRLRQAFGQEIELRVLYLTRTWAFAIPRETEITRQEAYVFNKEVCTPPCTLTPPLTTLDPTD